MLFSVGYGEINFFKIKGEEGGEGGKTKVIRGSTPRKYKKRGLAYLSRN